MKKIVSTLLLTSVIFLLFSGKAYSVEPEKIDSVIVVLVEKHGESQHIDIEKGVKHIAAMWFESDGDDDAFGEFCIKNFIADPVEKEVIFLRISDYLEAIYGHNSEMSQRLGWNITINTGPIYEIDEMFSRYRPVGNTSSDMFRNKIAFYIALNFPPVSLEEKQLLGNDRKAFAYARMGDLFKTRRNFTPTGEEREKKTYSEEYKDLVGADKYVADYNIYMGHLLDNKGNKIFPEDMLLLCHWNLRDEIKGNYSRGKDGVAKQRMVYEVMKRIISQEIPVEVINSSQYDWNPYKNEIYRDGKRVDYSPEGDVRYRYMVNNFRSAMENSELSGEEYLDQRFIESMEMKASEIEDMFDKFMSAPELKEVGKIITKRLGRKMEGFDIWYDGFKSRSNIDEAKLDEMIREMYPDAEAMERDLPNILIKLGFTPERAEYLGSKIGVDNARGSGHAAGVSRKGAKARLRTRIPQGGMDYKGFNIAIHEFGHNVEQVISIYDVDYYMLRGVPNTSFTEALAFVFQKKDLDILGIENNDPERYKMEVLDKVWSLFEICGVSMLDIAMWRWLFDNPEATASQLRDQAQVLAKEIWNKYYAPVFGVKDQTVLAIYQHMIHYPLYLPSYAFGQIIEFQLNLHFQGKNFADEVGRIYKLGCLTPSQWMLQATGNPLSMEPIMEALRGIIEN